MQCAVLYRTALSLRVVEVVQTSFEVLIYLQGGGCRLYTEGLTQDTKCDAGAFCPVHPSGHYGLSSVFHFGVSPLSGGCKRRPVLDTDPVFCPSVGVNIRRLCHEALGSIPGQFTWNLWGTEWHRNRLFSEYLRYPLSVLFRRTVTVARNIMLDNFPVRLAAREMVPTR